MDEMNGEIREQHQTQEIELQSPMPNAPRPVSEHDPIQESVVDPAVEPGHAPPQVLPLEEQLAPQPSLPQGATNRPILPNRPLQDLFADDRRRDFFNICVPLYEASMKGDWNAAREILQRARQSEDQDHRYLEVESMIPSLYTERTNATGKTPHDLFTKTHKELVSEGEKWMKGTASKSMVVAALIATIVFGVAYTIPGAYDQTTGFPKFRHKATFIVFVVIDAISLVLSSTSILVFLSILTSRYAQDDFIESLPKLLIFGLSMLFLSIVTMMIAFSVSFFVLYDHKFYFFVAGCISLLALVPMVSYAILHFPLLKYIFHSTYGSKSLFKPKKQMLYYTNPRV